MRFVPTRGFPSFHSSTALFDERNVTLNIVTSVVRGGLFGCGFSRRFQLPETICFSHFIFPAATPKISKKTTQLDGSPNGQFFPFEEQNTFQGGFYIEESSTGQMGLGYISESLSKLGRNNSIMNLSWYLLCSYYNKIHIRQTKICCSIYTYISIQYVYVVQILH